MKTLEERILKDGYVLGETSLSRFFSHSPSGFKLDERDWKSLCRTSLPLRV